MEKKVKSIDQKNEELKAQLAEQDARIAALEKQLAPKPTPAPRAPEGVQVRYPAPVSSFVMPTPEELRALYRIAVAANPYGAPKGDWSEKGWSDSDLTEKFQKEFRAAFLVVNSMKRLNEPNHKRFAYDIVFDCERWLKAYGVHAEIGRCFHLAVLASGDIPYQNQNGSIGAVLEYGLASKEHEGGRIATDAWRRVLATGKVLQAFVPAGSRQPAGRGIPKPVRVTDEYGNELEQDGVRIY
jgi:hypothetical protein